MGVQKAVVSERDAEIALLRGNATKLNDQIALLDKETKVCTMCACLCMWYAGRHVYELANNVVLLLFPQVAKKKVTQAKVEQDELAVLRPKLDQVCELLLCHSLRMTLLLTSYGDMCEHAPYPVHFPTPSTPSCTSVCLPTSC